MAAAFAGRLSLIAFATVALRGAIAGADLEGGLYAALVAAGAAFAVGMVTGLLARWVVEEDVRTEWERLSTDANTPPADGGRND
ncbi:MAG: hypothetical protein KY476_06830 [Planctomycetes bacterium]|nr:hypothetical protein [Planctomycetota bacterium]